MTPETPVISGPLRLSYLIGLVILPFVVLAAAVPFVWRWGLTWWDLVLTVGMYSVGILGITAGYHRLFTHRSYKAKRWLRITLAIAGGLALEGPVRLWVVEHRRHHQFADKAGDPHSPWRYGRSRRALWKGLWHAQVGWFAGRRPMPDYSRYAPDLLQDPDIARIDRWYPMTVAASLLLPSILAGLLTGSWWAMVTAFFWAGLVRYAIVHHVTWSVNSIAHSFGERNYATPDESRDVWWVALLTFGEGWHNYHHAAPSSAKHGALAGQFDLTAEVIRIWERLGWVHDVRWPDPKSVARKRTIIER